jgi:signal peptidase II
VPSADADRPGHPPRRPGSRRRTGVALGTVVAVVALDQTTKAWAVAALADEPIAIIGDDIELRLGRNTGGAFSLFQGGAPLLAVLAIVVAAFLLRALRRAEDTPTLVGLSLVLGGALGNLGDRLFRSPGFLEGAVVDFVRLGPWPTFNVADAAITVGAAVLVVHAVIGVVRDHRAGKRTGARSSDETQETRPEK